MKFIHAADLHVDSPLRGLDHYDGAPVARLRGATRLALCALVDLALAEQVDLVLLAGDIYDGNWTDFGTGLFFRQQMSRLTRAGVRVFVVKGNHDAESQISRQLPELEGMFVFSAAKAQTVDLPALGAAVHGRSFPNREVPEDFVPDYPPAGAGRFNIGVLHTSLNGRAGHDPYAPTSVEALCATGYDYFALGHVHAREVVREQDPRIVYPGNLQGRWARETGAKGCELVQVLDGRIVSAQFIELDVVRWHEMRIDVGGLSSLDALARAFVQQARTLAAQGRERLHALRIVLHGSSALQAVEARQPGTLNAALQAATQDIDDIDLWIEQVRLELRSPMDRQAAGQRNDAIGEVVRLVDSLVALGREDAGAAGGAGAGATAGPSSSARMTAPAIPSETALRDWILRQLDDLPSFPVSLADAHPEALNDRALLDLLADAEATVLAQLVDAGLDGPGAPAAVSGPGAVGAGFPDVPSPAKASTTGAGKAP